MTSKEKFNQFVTDNCDFIADMKLYNDIINDLTIHIHDLQVNKKFLVDLLNTCVAYGGDYGGPYFNEEDKIEIIKLFHQINIEPIFDKYGWFKALENKK